MAVTVAFRLRPRPDSVEVALRAVRRSFEEAKTARAGNRRARLFQRLGNPADLLDIGEWEEPGAVQAYVRTPEFATVSDVAAVPPRIEYYVSLHSSEWLSSMATVAACATVVATPEGVAAVGAYLREDVYRAIAGMPGIVYQTLNQGVDDPSRFLSVHGWAALADLGRFRAEISPPLEGVLTTLGALVDLFTGVVIAEYPPMPPPA